MNLKINISSNVQNHTWSGIAAHVDRDYKNDSNKGINPKYTKYNEMLSTQSLTQAINQHFEPLVKKHDQSKSVKKNPARAYKSVKNYLKRRKGNPESTIVLKIGGLEDKDKLRALVQSTDLMTKSEAISKVKRANDYAFKLYVKGYKERHPLGKSAIPMGNAETNEDEQGADHLHYNIADLGFTSKGNASMGFSRAVCREYHTNNRLKAMKIWHSQEDPAMLQCMNKSYQRFIRPDIHFSLSRTNRAYHLEQPLYKDAMEHRDQMMIQADKAFQSLQLQAEKLKNQNSSLKLSNQNLQNRLHHTKQYNHSLYKKVVAWSQSYSLLRSNHEKLKNQIHGLVDSSEALKKSLSKPKTGLNDWFKELISEKVESSLKNHQKT